MRRNEKMDKMKVELSEAGRLKRHVEELDCKYELLDYKNKMLANDKEYLEIGATRPHRPRRVAMERMIADRLAKAVADLERDRIAQANAEGSSKASGCSHKTFMSGKPHPFNGTEDVVGLTRWIEKVEQVFRTCKCVEEDQVMYAASTFEGRALTWWNGNLKTLGSENAN
nr:putative reverse transcriptase domain-containing protein [Tanacetum cinerariifolium]